MPKTNSIAIYINISNFNLDCNILISSFQHFEIVNDRQHFDELHNNGYLSWCLARVKWTITYFIASQCKCQIIERFYLSGNNI